MLCLLKELQLNNFTYFITMHILENNINNKYMEKKMRFIIYGLMGWCTEIFFTGAYSLMRGDITLRGFTYIWMFPIYGLLILLEPIHNRIRNWSMILRGGVYAVLILIGEYTTGSILKFILGICPWNYENSPFVISGIAKLDYAPFWFIAGLLFEKLHDVLIGYDSLRKYS
ncbi:hypothetical protein CLLI_16110 [Clostridium liquoris]|uniref:ABC-transporter type IV n=2 Tax=Clostridium liquoris TaxID=1289519 RepID=A0A2T0B435_9CLOT|nr:hypothetical protein CLLI_16110 [Clostridium liquoris]